MLKMHIRYAKLDYPNRFFWFISAPTPKENVKLRSDEMEDIADAKAFNAEQGHRARKILAAIVLAA